MKHAPFILYFFFLVMQGCKQENPAPQQIYQPYQKKNAHTPVLTDSSRTTPTESDSLMKILEGMDRGVNTSHRYFIVLASYTVHEFALLKKNEMIEKGFRAELIMQNDDGWYRLALESYNDKTLAQAALTRFHSMGEPYNSCRIVFR